MKVIQTILLVAALLLIQSLITSRMENNAPKGKVDYSTMTFAKQPQ